MIANKKKSHFRPGIANWPILIGGIIPAFAWGPGLHGHTPFVNFLLYLGGYYLVSNIMGMFWPNTLLTPSFKKYICDEGLDGDGSR
jgi:hypothetical protein